MFLKEWSLRYLTRKYPGMSCVSVTESAGCMEQRFCSSITGLSPPKLLKQASRSQRLRQPKHPHHQKQRYLSRQDQLKAKPIFADLEAVVITSVARVGKSTSTEVGAIKTNLLNVISVC